MNLAIATNSVKTYIAKHPTRLITPPRKMKLRYTTFGACFVCSAGWMQVPTTKSRSRMNNGLVQSFTSDRTKMDGTLVRLKATVVPEAEDVERRTSLSPIGNPIGEGSVVSCLPGGLVAVKVDNSIDLSMGSPEVQDLTNALPKEQKKQSNLGGDLIGRQVLFASGEVGVVVTHRPPLVFVYTDKDEFEISEQKVTILENLSSINVPENVSSTDCLGRPLERHEGESVQTLQRPVFCPIPKVKDIALINKPLLTGITMFDALSPIGRGQNMLLVGHDIDDMRQYVCDILSIQRKNTKCVYAATSNEDDIKKMLKDSNILDDIVLVSGGTKDKSHTIASAAEATVTAATACSIAEAFATEKGMDTLVIIDTLDQHKALWDATTRVLVDVFGIEAVVKGDRDGGASSEMRAFFSSLIQRAARFKTKYGGGSVTLLLMNTIPKRSDGNNRVFGPEDFEGSPEKVKERIDMLVQRNIPLTADNLRKIQIPIPCDSEGSRRFAVQHVDDLISMTDGQIWLDEELAKSGRSPCMDYQRSITRIGIGADTESRADAPAIRQVVEGLRLDLSQALAMDGADIETNASKKQIRAANAWLLAMHQPSASGARKLSESCTALLAASKGHLDDSIDNGFAAGTSEGTKLINELIEHVNTAAPAAMDEVDRSQDMSSEVKCVVEDAIKSYFDK